MHDLGLSFPKTPSAWIRAMRQNQRIMLRDACIPSAAWDVCRQPVQVAAPARSRESLSPPKAQYCAEECTRRLRLRGSDRALMVWMTWFWPSLLYLSRIVQPDTILRWHRAGFRAYWGWKSRARPGR